jgi:hypothetical protein
MGDQWGASKAMLASRASLTGRYLQAQLMPSPATMSSEPDAERLASRAVRAGTVRLDVRLPAPASCRCPALMETLRTVSPWQLRARAAAPRRSAGQRGGPLRRAPLRPLHEAAARDQPEPHGAQQGRLVLGLPHRVQRDGQHGRVEVPDSPRWQARLQVLLRAQASSVGRAQEGRQGLPAVRGLPRQSFRQSGPAHHRW